MSSLCLIEQKTMFQKQKEFTPRDFHFEQKKEKKAREQAREQLWSNSLPTGTNFSLFSAEVEVKMYRSYRQI